MTGDAGRQADDVGARAAIGARHDVSLIVAPDRASRGTPGGRRSPAYIVGMAPRDLVPAQLSDGDLLAEVARLAACEREATAALVALLAEVEARRLHLADGCSSLFAYCTERLHLSEHAAYHRIEAARAVRAFPVILAHLRDGSLTLTAVTLLRPHLTEENHERLLTAACGRSKREVEVLVRGVAPLPEVRASVRKLPATGSAAATSPTWTPVVSAARDDARAAVPPAAGAPPPASDAPPATCGASLAFSALAGDAGGAVPCCAARVVPAGGDSRAGTGALQPARDAVGRGARPAASGPGSPPPHGAGRRPGGDRRAGAGAAGRTPGPDEVRPSIWLRAL